MKYWQSRKHNRAPVQQNLDRLFACPSNLLDSDLVILIRLSNTPEAEWICKDTSISGWLKDIYGDQGLWTEKTQLASGSRRSQGPLVGAADKEK
ncbi:7400_t:CDS:2 [Ambispora gerdemannii]|uniref:7400_t:CDS:1 n=1 Tax=Ambispora gerdemannii TaxID=144530 RepID=A0A9N8YKT7_9GLOM|nr:7400_t:CDS:2 [Ambispora gerdemannii]